MSEWVTEQDAIDTLLALNEVRDGDELLLEGSYRPYAHLFPSNVPHRVITNQHRDHLNDEVIAIVADAAGSGWYVTRHQIKGWRRPRG